ncbi:unnamed protein product [Urochloa decumbens]|uniref:F-box domain-containing protein n=1 Tax=Urochloa decumbens TaxID=240449 RepID=A0ABC9G1P5_9POAL
MGEAVAKKKPQLTGDLARLTEDHVTDILLRLPAKSVLRCRAVCKAWRDITSTPGFLSAHARLRPADVVLYTYQYVSPARRRGGHFVDVGLDVVPVSSSDEAGRRRLIRYPKAGDWFLLASSDGVLLFKKNQEFFVLFNPTTGQWAELPRLGLPQKERFNRSDREYAFYLDAPSGEFRLLCRRSMTGSGKWCILSTGAAKPRHVDLHAAEAAGITKLVSCLRTAKAPHVPLHGCLHWPPHRATVTGQTEMVVFDMSLETFHLMAGPPTTTCMLTKLFDMDGLLVTADFGMMVKHVDLWFLEDYGTRRWELRHRVASPWRSGYGIPVQPSQLLSVAAAGDKEGNIMLGNNRGLAVYNVRTNKTVKAIDYYVATSDKDVLLSRHVFKESLVQQPGFVAAAQSSIDLSLVHF